MLDLYEEFDRVVRALEEARIPYAVCGGLAVSLHAQPRATQDIDLMLRERDLDALKAALLPLGYEERSLPMALSDGKLQIRRLTKLETGGTDTMLVDILFAHGKEASSAWRTRRRYAWKSGRVSMVSPRGLITLKRMRGSTQDLADIEALMKPKGEA